MADSVTFWLDNKSSSGVKVGQQGSQTLVSYRDRYYVIENGSAKTKAGKPLRYSQSSLPAIWKKVLRGDYDIGEETPAQKQAPSTPKPAPKATASKKHEEPIMPEAKQSAPAAIEPLPQLPSPPKKEAKVQKKPSGKNTTQTKVPADCPYCGHANEIPIEKGDSGKPFFQTCSKCKSDFAVRFVPITVIQAQVAGFR